MLNKRALMGRGIAEDNGIRYQKLSKSDLFRHIKQINFERESLVFTAGERIKGSFTFLNEERATARICDLQLQLAGFLQPIRKGRIYKPMPEADGFRLANFCTLAHKPLEVYSHQKISEDEIITRRQNSAVEVPFDLQIPLTQWSSFVGQYGYSYCTIILKAKDKFMENHFAILLKEIVIIGLVSPIQDGFDVPILQTQTETSKGKIVKLEVMLEKACASPGEFFKFKVHIKNGLNLPLSCVKMILQQDSCYKFFIYRDRSTRIIFEKEGPLIGPGKKESWNGGFEVPHVVPSGMGKEGCKFITVRYQICFVLSKFVNLRINLPMHIGTRSVESAEEWDSVSLAYGSELRRSVSEMALDSEGHGDWWTSLLENEMPGTSANPGRTAPPSYNSEWGYLRETPPPTYGDAVEDENQNDEGCQY